MDERIKALAKQAGFPEWSEKTIGFELEKFAELIVTEDARDEVKRLREELRVSRQSTTILIESLDSDIERLRENAKQDAKFLSAYHRICQKHGIAPSSSDLIEAMKGDE